MGGGSAWYMISIKRLLIQHISIYAENTYRVIEYLMKKYTLSLSDLDEMERKVIDYRYFKDYTQQEIANILGINQVKVSRLESKGKRKIKEYISA